MIIFEYLKKSDFSVVANVIFNILADNMTVIAPTGNSIEEDYRCWYDAVSVVLQREERQIILIKDSGKIIGYFQYSINADTFMMEEIQFETEYQGKGIFRELYGFVFSNINKDIEFVEAYASINNVKSIGILEKFGLSNIGLNKNGRSYHFKGRYSDLITWYENG